MPWNLVAVGHPHVSELRAFGQLRDNHRTSLFVGVCGHLDLAEAFVLILADPPRANEPHTLYSIAGRHLLHTIVLLCQPLCEDPAGHETASGWRTHRCMTINTALTQLTRALNGEESAMALGEYEGTRMVQLPLDTLLELMAAAEGQYVPEPAQEGPTETAVAAELWNSSAAVRLGLKPSFDFIEDRLDLETVMNQARLALAVIDQKDTLDSQEETAGLPVGSVLKDNAGRALQVTPRGLMAIGEEYPLAEVRGSLTVLSREPEDFKRLGWLRPRSAEVEYETEARAA